MDLDSLQIFKAVVDYGSITNAAAQLHRVQSNITTRVKNADSTTLGHSAHDHLDTRSMLTWTPD
ncbi:LysR family transcriptional regulator, partial [Pseudomonas putida]|uniref:LysR family transcriptional regulator n=1 Tax=Pseudomonas putida TaxID=303 RepID=UPI003525F50E